MEATLSKQILLTLSWARFSTGCESPAKSANKAQREFSGNHTIWRKCQVWHYLKHNSRETPWVKQHFKTKTSTEVMADIRMTFKTGRRKLSPLLVSAWTTAAAGEIHRVWVCELIHYARTQRLMHVNEEYEQILLCFSFDVMEVKHLKQTGAKC